MKNLMLIFGCLLLSVISSQAAENKQIDDVDRYIAGLRQSVESYYSNQILEVKQRAEAEISLLEVVDKAVYASLGEQAMAAKTVLHINNYGFRAPWYLEDETERMLQLKDKFSKLNAPERFAAAQSRIAERKSEILAKLTFATADLERQKNYALAITLPKLEKRLKQNSLKTESKQGHGLVSGIVYSADKPCAAIGRKVVREGDVIEGVTVVKINRDSVKFSRKNKTWEQKVQQAPDAYW